MATINRRDLLASLGVLGGSACLAGCRDPASSTAVTVPEDPAHACCTVNTQPPGWDYLTLDPEIVADRVYRIYPEGGCMYALVGSVIGMLADKVGEPFRSFPFQMMRYGSGGIGHWGSICGVVNGAAALIGLFQNEKEKERREQLITEFCMWYETTSLPQYEPSQPQWADKTEPSVAGSLLCHVSITKWCQATGCDAYCMEKKERCRRLAADGAAKVTDILNRNVTNEFKPTSLDSERQACIDCHGEQEQANVKAKINCAACHQFDQEHP